MSTFNPGTYQSGDGNLNEPFYVGRTGQQVVMSSPYGSGSAVIDFDTMTDIPADFIGTARAIDTGVFYTGNSAGIFLSNKPPLYNKVIFNQFPTEYVSDIAQSITAGTGTPTIVKDDALGKITITIPAGLTGRAFIVMPSFEYLAGHTYCVSFKVGNFNTTAFGGDNLVAISGAQPTLDFGTTILPKASVLDNMTHAVIFQPDLTQTVTAMRIGFGHGGNDTAGALDAVVEISEIMIEDLSVSGLNIPGEYIGPKKSVSILSNYTGALANQFYGALTLTNNTKYPDQGISVAVFGDSYTNDPGDYPGQLQGLIEPKIGVWYQITTVKGSTVAGTRPASFLSTFQTKMQALIDAGQKPKYALLQSSLNTSLGGTLVTQDARIAEDLAAINTAAEWAISKGIQPIFTNMAAWKTGAGAGWITDGLYLAQQKWDAAIYSLAGTLKVPVFDLRRCTEDPNTPYLILAAYDSGDGIHPNAAGFLVIATKLQEFIASL